MRIWAPILSNFKRTVLHCAFAIYSPSLATFHRKNALSDIGRVTLHATDIVSRGDFARVHSRARGEWTVPA
jgi:hypothetical protein